MENKIYDLIIIGAGPAGLSASIYASRYKLEHLIFGMGQGGQMNEIHMLENYPGFISISGRELIQKMVEQAANFGIEIKNESVSLMKKKEDGNFEIETSRGKYSAKTIILAMGAEYRKINIPGEEEFVGKGVSYCATCDAPFFRNKVVSVIGGGNSAGVVALELAEYASKVYLIYRGEKFSIEPVWMDKILANKKIEAIKGTNIIEIKGRQKVEKIILDKPYNDKTFLEVDGVFVEIGSEPGVELAQKIGIETDEKNFIKINPDQSTNIDGIFAAGDVTTGSNKFRQVLTAAAEGAIAANSIYKKLKL